MKTRCEWATKNEMEKEYHDKEWGVPVHNDRKLFEFLILEGAQAGLSWLTILKKRRAYVKAYDHFDAEKIACYDDRKIKSLLNNPGIVRNRLKIAASIDNARAFLKIQEEYGSFDKYIWRFVGNHQRINNWSRSDQIPARTEESELMSRDLVSRGFKFTGPTICYAFMQAVGMVNDHTSNCYRHREISKINLR